jgi:hypothetical protein
MNEGYYFSELDPTSVATNLASRSRGIDEEKLAAMMEDVRQRGVRVPIEVRYSKEDGTGQPVLISGLHRLECAYRLKLASIPAIVRKDVSRENHKVWELTENLRRVDLTASERRKMEAELLKTCTDRTGFKTCTDRTGGRGPSQSWFREWFENAGVKKTTALDRWRKFLETVPEDDRVKPSRAEQPLREAFAAWYEEHEAVSREEFERAKEEERRRENERKADRVYVAFINLSEDQRDMIWPKLKQVMGDV